MTHMDAVWEWFTWLHGAYGIDLTIAYDAGDRRRFLMGFLTTVELSAVCMAASIAIGVLGAWLQGSRFAVTGRLVRGYIQFFRNTPPLVQMYLFYFGIGGLITLCSLSTAFR